MTVICSELCLLNEEKRRSEESVSEGHGVKGCGQTM